MKFVLFLLAFSFATLFAQERLVVEAFDEQANNSSQITLRLRVTNNTTDTLTNIRARYFLNYERGRNLLVSQYYLAGANVSLDTLGDFLAVNIDFPLLATGVSPNVSGISLGLSYADNLNFNKSDNFSYPGSGEFSVVNNIPIYANGTFVSGITPVGDEIPKIRFVGIQPENSSTRSAWIELENYGEISINLNKISVSYKNNYTAFFDSLTLYPKEKLKICVDSLLLCSQNSEFNVFRSISLDSVGSLFLLFNSKPIDYIAWGQKSDMDDFALEFIDDVGYFFSTEIKPIVGPILSYEKGDFYRSIAANKDLKQAWAFYKYNDIEKSIGILPDVEPLSLSDSSQIYLNFNEKMIFSWTQVSGATLYDFSVIKKSDSTEIIHLQTKLTTVSINLSEGEYLWTVVALTESQVAGGFFSSLKEYAKKRVLRIATLKSLLNLMNLHIEPMAARKDSYLIDLKWGSDILKKKWDSPHNLTRYLDENNQLQFSNEQEKMYDSEESWRCWIVAATMLNHYYGGNITEDEIKMHIKGNMNNIILDAFPHGREGGGYLYDINNALMWALNLTLEKIHYNEGRPSENDILLSLNSGKPVVIWQNSHIMVIDAAKINKDTRKIAFRFMNVDNNGHYEWKNYETENNIYCYWFPDSTSNPRMSNVLVHSDIDNDGLKDYDELYRFNTSSENLDSDGDGISDKIEIMSYTLLEKNPGIFAKNGYLDYYGIQKEVFADIDDDSLRAEKDSDSDNGGKSDGDEDKNYNGFKDENETSPYMAADDIKNIIDIPQKITLVALNELRYNDGVVCYKDSTMRNYCSVASLKNYKLGEYALIVGARANVGSLYSKGNVFLRSNAHIYGDVYIDSLSMINEVSLQNGSSIDGTILAMSNKEWFDLFSQVQNISPLESVPDLPTLNIQTGHSAILQNGTRYSSINVMHGATLFIPAGDFWVDSIQLDPGSNIQFINDGQASILHISGKFIWRATMQGDLKTIAKSFKLVQYAYGINMFIDKNFGGTIIAPFSNVVIGQSQKLFYGTVLANNLSIHQYTTLWHIDFSPMPNNVQYVLK